MFITCQVCGKQESIFDVKELKPIYRIFEDAKDICSVCGDELDKHVNYYGHKSETDKSKVRHILLNGKLVQDRFNMMMNAGYC